MRIRLLTRAPVNTIHDVHLAAGYSLAFSKDWSVAYAPYPISVSEMRLEDEAMGRLRRVPIDGIWHFELTKKLVPCGRVSSPAIPLNLLHSHNYFHFLVEWLPSLQRLIDLRMVERDTILVTGRLHPNFTTGLDFILQAAGLDPAQLRLRSGQSVACDKLVVTGPSAHGLQRLDGSMADSSVDGAALLRLREVFRPLRQPGLPELRKLYVRRISPVRKMVNAAAIEQLAIEAGYSIVQPELMSFVDQVSLFTSATDIVGPTGAWAANLVFARPGTRVSIFCPETARGGVSLWSAMGAALYLQVRDIFCPVTQVRQRLPVHSDFEAPIEIARAVLGVTAAKEPVDLEA